MYTELLNRIFHSQKGDKEALEDLILQFTPIIKHYKYLLNYDDAEQDMILSFIETIQKLPVSLLHSRDSDIYILSYIKQSMKNYYIHFSKLQRVFQYCAATDSSILENFQGKRVDDTFDLKQSLQKELDKLTSLQKKVLIYKYCYGFSDCELSCILHVSRQAVCQAKGRGLKALRTSLSSF